MTKIPATSPTQIRLFARCPRAYWYTYPNGERQPRGPGAELGTRLHNEFERLLGGPALVQDVDPRVKAAAMELHNHERHDVTLESWVSVGNVRGRVDLLVVDGDAATVLDLKTTSNAKYALEPSEIATDIQMVCYGLAVADAHPAVRYVTLVHLYTLTKGAPKAWRSETCVHVDDLRKHYDEHIAPLVDGARALWHDTEPPPALENAPNTPACNAYGGCPFRARCGERSPIPEQDPMVGLVEQLYNRLTDENRAEFDSMCEHVDFAAWQSEDLAGAYDVLKAMVDTQPSLPPGTSASSDPRLVDLVSRPVGVSTKQSTDGTVTVQPILPPDATPNAAIDPLDVPLTEVDGVGKVSTEKAGGRSVREYEQAHTTTSGNWLSESLFGLSEKQHDAVLAYARERDRPTPQAPEAEQEVEDASNWDREHYESVIERLRTHVFAAMHAIDHALSALDELE